MLQQFNTNVTSSLSNSASNGFLSSLSCQNCQPKDENNSSKLNRLVIAKCHECQNYMCSSCVFDHQLTLNFAQHNLTLLNGNELTSSQSAQQLNLEENFSDADMTELALKKFKTKEGSMQLNQQHFKMLQQFQSQQQQQQQQLNSQSSQTNCLMQIETEIQKTFKFYIQAIKDRRDYLIKELNAIAQYALFSQNKNSQSGQSGQDPLTSDVNNNNTLAGNPLKAIEFTSNFSAIQTSIRNTFGYLRINQSQNQMSQQPPLQSWSSSMLHNHLTSPLTVSCDQAATSGQTSTSGYSTSSFSGSASSASSGSYRPKAIGSQSAEMNKLSFSNQKNGYSMFGNNASPVSTLSQHGPSSSDDFMHALLSNTNNHNGATESNSNTAFGYNKRPYDVNKNMSARDKEGDFTSNWSSLANNKYFPGSMDDEDDLYDINSAKLCLPQQASSPPPGLPNSLSHSDTPVSDLHSAFPSDICLSAESAVSSKSSHFSDNEHKTSGGNLNTSRTSNSSTSLALAIRPLLKRSKMIYNCKFGEFGINDGQFTEPSGVSINTGNDIIVADTNSHRIQIFDREGRFKFKFGECGKRDGQLLYPNRVAVVKLTGDIVVTERSPTHQIQIYNKYGMFLRKFGANILQHPRGVCVDSIGRIIVVECKVMRVIIFDLLGNVLQKFNCSKYLEFPNGVCCSNEREEIFISDNRAHCIKVFDYAGHFLRQIGGEGITNYPIGVGINSLGQVLVADNHNNFNLTVFTQEGNLICALESKVKHAQCFDVGLMDDGSIVLASKDYRIYVYKYNNGQIQQVSSHNIANANGLSNANQHTIDQTYLINSSGRDMITNGESMDNQQCENEMSNLNLSDSSNNNFLLSSISNLCNY